MPPTSELKKFEEACFAQEAFCAEFEDGVTQLDLAESSDSSDVGYRWRTPYDHPPLV